MMIGLNKSLSGADTHKEKRKKTEQQRIEL